MAHSIDAVADPLPTSSPTCLWHRRDYGLSQTTTSAQFYHDGQQPQAHASGHDKDPSSGQTQTLERTVLNLLDLLR